MPGMDSNHCRIVEDGLSGKRPIDEQTFTSLVILDERLERVKKLGGLFSKIGFSSDVERLARHEMPAAVGQAKW